MRRSVHTATLLIIAALVVVSFSGVQIGSSQVDSGFLVTGPYIDEVIYRVIANQDQRILALQTGTIHLDSEYFDPVHFPAIDSNPDLEIFSATRNGYGHITINCAKYPLNISGLRRAFAFAFDKTAVTIDIMDGFSREHDSLVPYGSQWCIEDDLPWHYYVDQAAIGNEMLDDLGFKINEDTGYRNAPDGTPFQIAIDYFSAAEIAGGTAQIGVNALHNLHINARTRSSDFSQAMEKLETHTGDWDMMFYAVNFRNDNIQWLASEYWSEYANVTGENPTSFQNTTYDGWRNQLLHGTSFEEVYEAGAEMQKILHYNVPRLVVYENTYLTAYRTAEFMGQISDKTPNIANQWTFRNIRQIASQFGGAVRVATGEILGSFNPYIPDLVGPGYYILRHEDIPILDLTYSSLFDIGPDGRPHPDLAVQMLQETHDDNPAILENHLRFTIDIIQNASWSDGEPLTAIDVAFTFSYMIENNLQQTPFNEVWSSSDLYAIYAPTPYRVIIEWASETYWHFSRFAYEYILPMHIFTNNLLMEGLDYLTWNPGLNESHPMVTSGPFFLKNIEYAYSHPVTYEFTYNPEFYFAPERPLVDNVTSNPTSLTTNGTTEGIMNWSLVFTSALVSGSGIVIIFCTIVIIRERQNLENI